jgi:hypothetical protein
LRTTFCSVALTLPFLCQGIALCPPMGVRPRKFPTGTLAFVGQGCATSIRQINHHNISIGSDTVANAVFISGFVAGASHLHRRSLSKPSGTHSGLNSNFVVRTDFRSLEFKCEERATVVPQLATLASGHWWWIGTGN